MKNDLILIISKALVEGLLSYRNSLNDKDKSYSVINNMYWKAQEIDNQLRNIF